MMIVKVEIRGVLMITVMWGLMINFLTLTILVILLKIVSL